MIDTTYARTMARYDRWQNRSLVMAADKMTDEERWQNRGAFFGSIAETLNHILWDHRIWLARQRGDAETASEIAAHHPYTDNPVKWSDYKRERAALDDEIAKWCERMNTAEMSRSVTWMRGASLVDTNFGFNLVHMFNHAIHHRGQVHAMLTAAGIDPGSTDLPMLPSDV